MSPQTSPLAGMHVLVVENSPLSADIGRVLRHRGGVAAVELLAHNSYARRRLSTGQVPHLVILDYDLADGNSAELAVWMLTQPTLDQTIRVSYSGRDTDIIHRDIQELLAQQGVDMAVRFPEVFDAYITKPALGLVDLLSTIVRTSTRQPLASADAAQLA
jgi:CheY-like chemotaxis protein